MELEECKVTEDSQGIDQILDDSFKNKLGSLVIPYKSLTLGEVIGEGQ